MYLSSLLQQAGTECDFFLCDLHEERDCAILSPALLKLHCFIPPHPLLSNPPRPLERTITKSGV